MLICPCQQENKRGRHVGTTYTVQHIFKRFDDPYKLFKQQIIIGQYSFIKTISIFFHKIMKKITF